MRLEHFISSRKAQWYQLRQLTERHGMGAKIAGDDLKEMLKLYRSASADLAHARSAFPYERVVPELNQLLGDAHQVIYGSRSFAWTSVTRFLWSDFPSLIRKHSRLFWISFTIFWGAAAIGLTGSLLNPELPRYILGDQYVDMTTQNIQSADPFGVYKSENSAAMSGFIMTNNIKVTFAAFAMGLFFGLGTLYVLFYNGLILGAFFSVFYKHNLLVDALVTVMQHGAIELTCIFLSASAGLLIGKALAFPGSYSRMDALRSAGGEAVQIILGIVPLLILAGIIEGFVTRLDFSIPLKAVFTITTVLLLIFYVVPQRTPKQVIRSSS